jgi:hypothetical protein
VEFDSQRMQIEFAVEKIEQLYSHDLDDKNPVPMLP